MAELSLQDIGQRAHGDMLAMPGIDPDHVDAGAAVLRQLDQYGVEGLDLSAYDLDRPGASLDALIREGAGRLEEIGAPMPDMGEYRIAKGLAEATDAEIGDALDQVESARLHTVQVGPPDMTPIPDLAFETPVTLDPEPMLTPVQLRNAVEEISLDDWYDDRVEDQISGTNFCEVDVHSQFRFFIENQSVERGMHDDFIFEQVASSWEELPVEIRQYEPTGRNIFGGETPYPGWVDDVGSHGEEQRFFGGYHLADEEDNPKVEVHFDAADSLRGPFQNLIHGYEVGLGAVGIIDSVHYPSEDASPDNEGRHPDWHRYEEYCDTVEAAETEDMSLGMD